MALAATPKFSLRSSTTKRGMTTSKATTGGSKTTSGRKTGSNIGKGDNNEAYLKSLPGVTAPFPDVFDPANLAAGASIKDIRRWRESEITHGRVAMLAALGFVVQENIKDSENFNFLGGKIVGPAIYHFQQIRQGFWEPLLIAIGLAEAYRVTVGWATPVGGQFNALRDDYNMGDLGFDPLGIAPKDPEEFKDMQTKELNNGRLAMIAIAGFTVQELLFQREFLVIPALHDAATPNIDGAAITGKGVGAVRLPTMTLPSAVEDINLRPPLPSYLPGGVRNAAEGVQDATEGAKDAVKGGGGLFNFGGSKVPDGVKDAANSAKNAVDNAGSGNLFNSIKSNLPNNVDDAARGARDVANSAKNAVDTGSIPSPPNLLNKLGLGTPKIADDVRDVANSAKNAADNAGLPTSPPNLFNFSGNDVADGAKKAADTVKSNLPSGVPTPTSLKEAVPDVSDAVQNAGKAVKNALPDGVPSPRSFKEAAQDNLPKPDPTADGALPPFLTLPNGLKAQHWSLMDIPNPFKVFTDPPSDPTIEPVPTSEFHKYDGNMFNTGDVFSRTPEAPRIGAPPSNQPIPNPNGDGGVALANSANPMKPAGLPDDSRPPSSGPSLKLPFQSLPGGLRMPHLTLADLPNPFKALSDNVDVPKPDLPEVPKVSGGLPDVPKLTNKAVNIDLPDLPNLPKAPELPKVSGGLPDLPKISNKDVNIDLPPNLPKAPELPKDLQLPSGAGQKIATPGVQGGPPSVPLKVPAGIPTK